MTNKNVYPTHVSGHAWLGYDPDCQTPADLHVMGCDLSSYGYVMIGPVEITVTVPAAPDPVALQIAALKRQRDAEQARSARRLAELDDRLAKLAAITYQPEVST